MRGQDDDGQKRVTTVDLFKQRQPVHAIHPQVGNQQIGTKARQTRKCNIATINRKHLKPPRLKTQGKQAQQTQVVVNKQDTGRMGHGDQQVLRVFDVIQMTRTQA